MISSLDRRGVELAYDAAMKSSDDVIRLDEDPTRLDADDWNALLAQQARPTPFMRLEYLCALHASRSAVPETGWTPRFVTLRRGGKLAAAAPAYLKAHSYGEYVFDWAWADAYRRHGLRYYPKLVVAVPFTPVPGTRLMAVDEPARRQLLKAIRALAADAAASSAHLLFHDAAEGAAADEARWLRRRGVQFHWLRDDEHPAADYEAFLATLQRDKRKKIQQERRRVAEAGVAFTVHAGRAIEPTLWDFFYRCYVSTYRAHQSTPYLKRAFFAAMAREMADHWVMFVGRRGGEPIAASLVAIDRERGVAYGRYWGATEYVPCLHFDACYYRPLQWCIEEGFARFEGGAQGEHKMARGLLPVETGSAHWLSHPAFARAVEEFLRQERAGVEEYIDELREHSPFKSTA
jgi:predicted N-acyltransferase